jgi:hypothetical protein
MYCTCLSVSSSCDSFSAIKKKDTRGCSSINFSCRICRLQYIIRVSPLSIDYRSALNSDAFVSFLLDSHCSRTSFFANLSTTRIKADASNGFKSAFQVLGRNQSNVRTRHLRGTKEGSQSIRIQNNYQPPHENTNINIQSYLPPSEPQD